MENITTIKGAISSTSIDSETSHSSKLRHIKNSICNFFVPLAIFSSSSSLGGKMCKYASIFSPHLPLERQFNQWAIFLLRDFWLLDNLTDNWVVKFLCNQGERTRAGLKIGALKEAFPCCLSSCFAMGNIYYVAKRAPKSEVPHQKGWYFPMPGLHTSEL